MAGALVRNFYKSHVILTGALCTKCYSACLQMRRWRLWEIKLLAQSYTANEAQTSSDPRSDF